MMKQQILTMMVLLSTITIANAQTGNVGINTITPAATLDVTGVATDPLKLDGIIAPRLTGNELAAKNYTPAQTGAMVYVTAAAGSLMGQVINVSAVGYYYFDGTVWVYTKGTGGTGTTTNILSTSGNNITSNVNGISSTAPAVNSNAISLTGSNITSTVNGGCK